MGTSCRTSAWHWRETYDAGPSRCGGKGHNLARLARYRFAVPPGGVLVADVYASVSAEPSVATAVGDAADIAADQVTAPAAQLGLSRVRDAITAAHLRNDVRQELDRFLREADLADSAIAVRSSAVGEDGTVASFAGIHESVLNVRGLEAVLVDARQPSHTAADSDAATRCHEYRRSKKVQPDLSATARYCSMSRRKIVRANVSGSGRRSAPLASRSAMMVRAELPTVAWPSAASASSTLVLPAPGPPVKTTRFTADSITGWERSGFLAHPALSRESEHQVSGNYGLLDQIAARRCFAAAEAHGLLIAPDIATLCALSADQVIARLPSTTEISASRG